MSIASGEDYPPGICARFCASSRSKTTVNGRNWRRAKMSFTGAGNQGDSCRSHSITKSSAATIDRRVEGGFPVR
jgi:hypothetical protein